MKKRKECGVVYGQVCGKKSPRESSGGPVGAEIKKERRRPRESAIGVERAPEAQGGCRRFRKNGGQERAETQGKRRGKRECKLRGIARVSWSRGKIQSGRVGRMKMG